MCTIATDDNTYIINAGTLGGLTTLPANNNLLVSAVDQDGADLFSNYYSTRVIMFQFTLINSPSLDYLNTTISQNNHVLEMFITTDTAQYSIEGTIVGMVEGGVVEFECTNPFFNRRDIAKQCTQRYFTLDDSTYLPMTMGQTHLGALPINDSVTVNTQVPTGGILTIRGSFLDCVVTNNATNTTYVYTGRVYSELVIDTLEETTYVDGYDKSENATGLYPSLTYGDNVLDISFSSRFSQVEVIYCLEVKANSVHWGSNLC